MDNHSFPNAIRVFISQHSDDDDDDTNTEDMPALVPLDDRGSQPTQPRQQSTSDVEMNEHDNSHDSESDRDAHEVEMQTVNRSSPSHHHAISSSSPSPHTFQDQPTVNNRRARVEDDEDEDRDRRHPSQRIGSSASASPSPRPSSSPAPVSSPPLSSAAPTPGGRLRGQAPIFSRTVTDDATAARTHPFRFFQHLMSNNNTNNINGNNDLGNTNPVLPPGGPIPAPMPAPASQPHQDGNTPHNQPQGRFETFSVTLDIGLSPAFPAGGGAQPPEGQAAFNAADLNANVNAQNTNILPGISIADFMARLGQAMGLDGNVPEETAATADPAGGNNDNNTPQGTGVGAGGPTAGAQFGFNIPPGFNLTNLAGLGFGFNFDGGGLGEKEDPERARKLVDGLEEVPEGLVRRLERVGGTGGGMGEDESKGGDGGCAICWDRLLSSEDDKHETNEEENGQPPEASGQASRPKIVSLPCAHVFHAECLIPWFSRPRQTTCPTCRFNIDPENLTYVSWRRRMRERREREREEARARGESESTDGNEAVQEETTPPADTTPAEPGVAILNASSISDQVTSFLSSLGNPSMVPGRSNLGTLLRSFRRTQTETAPRSQSQPPVSSEPSSSTDPAPSSSQPTDQMSPQEAANGWDSMPGLEDVSDSEDDEDNEDEGEEHDEDEDEDEEAGDREREDEQQAPPLASNSNEQPTTSTPGAQPQPQPQAPRPRQNDPLAPRTIQTAHGLITVIPVPFNFPFPPPGNGVGVGVQAGGDAANPNVQLPFPMGQGQGLNVNANANTQGFPQGHPLLHAQLPHMPEFGAQRGAPAPAPAPANTTANANLDQAVPPNPFVNAQQAAAITNTEEQLMQHLRSQGLTANQAEDIRRSTMTGRQADRLRRGENPVGVHLDLEDDDDDDMMDIDEGMGMVVDLTVNQGTDGEGTTGDPATQAEQDRQDFDHVMNFLNQAARQAQGQAQAGTQQTQEQEQGPHTQGGATGTSNAQNAQQPPQQQPQQPHTAPFPPGFSFGNFRPEDDRAINEFVSRMLSNLGASQQQQTQHAQQAQGQDGQPQSQSQGQQPPPPPQAQESATGPNPANANANANANNNGGRPRQAQFAFGNITFGAFPNMGPLFTANGTGNPNVNVGGQERVKKAWTLPPAPGPTLRQRIERRERDAGLRCYDISCGVGPSDEDPAVSDETIAAGLRQLMIMSKNHEAGGKEGVCAHTFHPGCLVSAERVALRGTEATVIEGGDVEVSCPVCRTSGCVTKQEWEEGILALA